MALVWNDATSFKRHLEHMKMFRRSHGIDPRDRLALIKDMPVSSETGSLNNTGGARGFIVLRGKPTVVPIWKIVLAGNSQN